jgi:hypothetical protein
VTFNTWKLQNLFVYSYLVYFAVCVCVYSFDWEDIYLIRKMNDTCPHFETSQPLFQPESNTRKVVNGEWEVLAAEYKQPSDSSAKDGDTDEDDFDFSAWQKNNDMYNSTATQFDIPDNTPSYYGDGTRNTRSGE